MTSFLSLLALAIAMFVTSYLAGLVPLSTQVARSHMRAATSLSSGILAGTVLMLVIPEAIESLLASQNDQSLVSFAIGFPILLGFILMYVIDNISNFDFSLPSILWNPCFNHPLVSSVLGSTITVSLILHALADGLALGVYSFGSSSLQLVFFFMIIIHKIPTVFSLAVILLKLGIAENHLHFHILLFSAASPISSILAYLITSIIPGRSPLTIAILLLFSAGTFLYSVIHVLMENKESHDYGTITEANLSMPDSKDVNFTLLTMFGMILPVLFSFMSE